MDLANEIRKYAGQLLSHQVLLSLLKGYRQPNIKISALVKKGVLVPIKKGLYIAGPMVSHQKPEPFLMANHLLGPSYVSLETALSYHGLIPERVFEVTSITTKAPRKFKTPLGVFSYARVPVPYYSFGLRQVKLSEDQFAMIATPEKALCDKIITTSGLVFRSKKNALAYTVESLRMDEDSLKNFNTVEIETWLTGAPKKDSIAILIKTIREL